MMGKVIVLTNLKGGVGKTTDTDMMAIVAAKKSLFNKKVLLIDVDLQANTTSNMTRTFGTVEYPQSFTKAVQSGTLTKAIYHLTNNLDLIPGSQGTHDLNEWILDNSKTKRLRYMFLKKMIDEIKDHYDYIFFDVAPSTDNSVDAITMTSDYIVAVQEVKRFSMDGTSMLIDTYLQPMLNAFPDDAHFQVAGILPTMFQTKRKNQLENYQKTVDIYGKDNVFSTIIKRHDRLEGFGEQGISLNDYEDRRMFALFADLFTELEKRIDSFEKYGDIVDFSYTQKYYDPLTNKTLLLGKEIIPNGLIE
jgi:chromosome partitioning protein